MSLKDQLQQDTKDALRAGDRDRLGVLRMAVFYLQSSGLDETKRSEYYQLMNDTIEKVEACLKRLRGLTDALPGSTSKGDLP